MSAEECICHMAPSTHPDCPLHGYPLPEILDAAIIRNPQPDDVLVLRVRAPISQQQALAMKAAASSALPCKVIILTGDVEITTVSEVTL